MINHDVPAELDGDRHPGAVVKLRGERVDLDLPRAVPPPGAEPVELAV